MNARLTTDLPKTPEEMNTRERRHHRMWILTSVLVWMLVPFLALQRFHITLFDLVMLAILGFVLANLGTARQLRLFRKNKPEPVIRWRLNGQPLFYGMFMLVILAGLMSGVNAVAVDMWLLEVMTFAYLLVMMITADLFASDRVREFLKIGAWVFVPICLLTGIGSILGILGVYKFEMFYQQVVSTGTTGDKFRGVAYTPNQWATLVLAMLPFLLALLVEKGQRWWLRIIILASIVVGALTLPGTGSRSGAVLLAIQVFIFLGLYTVLNRSVHPSRRAMFLVVGVLASVGTYLVLTGILSESWVIRRSFRGVDMLVEQRSVADEWRMLNWSRAVEEFSKHPVFGVGFGNFEKFYDGHEVHSSYLSLLAEGGLVALVAYVGLFILTLSRLGQLMLTNAALRQRNLMAIALFSCLSIHVVVGIFHSLIRNRHLALLMLMGLVYSDVELRRLKKKAKEKNLQHRAQEIARHQEWARRGRNAAGERYPRRSKHTRSD